MTDYRDTAPARLATRLSFLVAGFLMACCAPLFPFLKENVGADEKQFGLILLCLGLGSIVAMPVTGVVAARKGARSMVLLGGFGMVAILPILSIASSAAALGAALFVLGAFLGTIDVAMNVHGAEVEKREKRVLMSNFHAQFSIGGLLGAGFMTLALWQNVPIFTAALSGAICAGIAMLVARTRLLSTSGGTPAPLAMPKGIVLLLAVLAAVAFLVEGAVLDWGALLLIDLDLARPEGAGIGYIVFSVAMVVARLSGDWIVRRLGDLIVLITGGILAAIGIGIILIAPQTWSALAGFLMIGFGAANLVPILFSAAGRQTTMPAGLAVAAVTTTGYAGVLLGPAMVGFLADALSLPIAFALLALLMCGFPLTARIVARV